jgi:hypothetical protein
MAARANGAADGLIEGYDGLNAVDGLVNEAAVHFEKAGPREGRNVLLNGPVLAPQTSGKRLDRDFRMRVDMAEQAQPLGAHDRSEGVPGLERERVILEEIAAFGSAPRVDESVPVRPGGLSDDKLDVRHRLPPRKISTSARKSSIKAAGDLKI